MLIESPLLRRPFGFWNLLLRAMARTFAPRFTVTGRANLPWHQGVILAPNHTSDCDPFLLFAAMRQPAWWMAKQEIYEEFPAIAPLMRFAQAFPVDQKGIDRLALTRASEVLSRSEPLVIFPEGRTSKDGELGPLEPGLAMLALKHRVRVVPVGIAGATHILAHATLQPHITLRKVHIHFGPPLDFSDLAEKSKREARTEATTRIEAGIRAALAVARR
jgi:1-acyl-sn-glycerol-3-phosphate acyltransferase